MNASIKQSVSTNRSLVYPDLDQYMVSISKLYRSLVTMVYRIVHVVIYMSLLCTCVFIA